MRNPGLRRSPVSALITVASAFVVAAAVLVASRDGFVRTEEETACPAGYTSFEELEAREGGGAEAEGLEGLCVSNKHPESLAELSMMQAERAAMYLSANGTFPANARELSLAQRDALAAKAKTDELSHPWKPVGIGPLQSADEGYDSVNGLGLVELAGRITDFSYDKVHDDLYASVSSAASGGATTRARAGSRSATPFPPRSSARSRTRRPAAGASWRCPVTAPSARSRTRGSARTTAPTAGRRG